MQVGYTLLLILLTTMGMSAQTLIDFKETPTTENWTVVDDIVMGGRSMGRFDMTNDGHGLFQGRVSLENNGGFSSVKYAMERVAVTPKSKVKIRLKGDGNSYQFRVKANKTNYYSYVIPFKTTGKWETLEFELASLYPSYRGQRLNLPNFDKTTLEELRFLIGNKKEQDFTLHLASIVLVH